MLRRLRWFTPTATAAASILVAVTFVWAVPALRAPVLGALGVLECPAGYHETDPVALAAQMNPGFARWQASEIRRQLGERVCAWSRLPESFAEISEQQADRAAVFGRMPEGALRRAVEGKAALRASQPKVANAQGQWQEYGAGPLVGDPDYPSGSNDGIVEVAGRVDDFAYDPTAKRLFAAVGNGGIWMSEAVDGEIATLGDHWVPIGDGLPSLVASAVAWTPARSGRVIALTGEHTQGGGAYTGLGVYWSDDLGMSWNHAGGVPDGALAFALAVDSSRPEIVYAATGKGLFRSEDAGESFVNVQLPVSESCTGVEDLGPCQFANFVTDVIVKEPGGSTGVVCGANGCPVLAGVGFRAGNAPYPDGTPQAPGNGLYRSDSGLPGSFVKLDPQSVLEPITGGIVPLGFAPQERIGRLELGQAVGPEQDHDYVYAIVEDAVLFNGGFPLLDFPTDDSAPVATFPLSPTTVNGVYVSDDFGGSWARLIDDVGLFSSALTAGSSLAVSIPLGYGPGIQSWYNMWVAPNPTQQLGGAPTQIAFGLEELWQNALPLPPVPELAAVTGLVPLTWDVFGTYFAGDVCLYLIGNLYPQTPGLPVCPFYDGLVAGTTTHPDQQGGIFVPDDQLGGAWLFAGNDGGVYKQHTAGATDPLRNDEWGRGANLGFYTLMNYGISVSRDGTVWFGLQDNSSGKIEPDTRRQLRVYVGDGVWTAVHPDDSNIAYYQTPGLYMVRTNDGGKTYSYINPSSSQVGTAHFLSTFVMDPLDPEHLVAAGTSVAELLNASEATSSDWITVFDLGVDEASGAEHQARQRPIDVQGDAVYVGWCGPCNLAGSDGQFQRGIATNVGGELPPKKGTPDGWHLATAAGLPRRYIYEIEIDPADPETIYVVLGGYSTARWAPPGQYLDENDQIGSGAVYKSTDAGESFVSVSGDLPQDLIATAILKRGDQLVIGTDIGVFISSDPQGSQWAPLGDLPNVPVNQLVLKPGDDRALFASTFGRGVQLYTFGDTANSGDDGGSGGEDGGRFGGALPALTLSVLAFAVMLNRRRRRAR